MVFNVKTIQIYIDESVYHKEVNMSRGENLAVCRISYLIAFLVAMFIINPMLLAAANYQEIYLMPDNVNKSIGSTFNISVMYNVTTNDNTLTGVGIRVHYDSTKLTYKNASNIVSKNIGLMEKYEDPDYSDNDSSTDRVIVIAWADKNAGAWPNEVLPCKLVDLSFQVKTTLTSGNTHINTGFTSVAAGYYGNPSAATIHITTMPTVSWEIDTKSLDENDGSFDVKANLSYVSTEHDITIPVTLAGTAELLTDYFISSQTLFIPSGEQSATVSITIVNDLYIEDDETIELSLGSSENVLTDVPDTLIVTIANDDAGHFTETIITTPESVVYYGDDFSINGESADIGDEIGAFDPDGILCGRTIIDNEGVYVLTVYKDDSSTEDMDEGAVENDELTFKVWDLSSDSEYIVSGEMFSPKILYGSIPACEHTPPQWTANNDRWGLNISITGNQEIPLRAGWNLFSFSVNMIFYDSETPPVVATLSNATAKHLTSLSVALTTIDGKYDLIRNFDINGAQTFDPNVPSFFNTLHYLAAGYGYWIKMKEICNEEECKLTLSGPRAKPSDTLTLREGWNLIGCWHTEAPYDSASIPTVPLPSQVSFKKVDDLKNVFSSINESYSIVRNFDKDGASTFDPNVPSFFNTLHYMGPGYGYWIKMTETKEFNY
jgi:hypothetical protein